MPAAEPIATRLKDAQAAQAEPHTHTIDRPIASEEECAFTGDSTDTEERIARGAPRTFWADAPFTWEAPFALTLQDPGPADREHPSQSDRHSVVPRAPHGIGTTIA